MEALKNEVPHIVVGTPGRIVDLATQRKVLDLSKVKHFVLDECDRMLAEVSMRRDVQTIFKATPHEKQVGSIVVIVAVLLIVVVVMSLF